MSKNHKNYPKFEESMDTKQPRAAILPNGDKILRATLVPNENCPPDFRTERMDLNGPWRWDNIEASHLQDLLQNVFCSQKLTWQALRDHGSHLIDVPQLISDAQKRLHEIAQDDVDQLYSLRLSGIKRVWGIKENNILWMLWWDPFHSICPSAKKHT